MRPGRFLLGLTFIVVGTVMFLVNMGYTSWSFLFQLLNFWPVLLILFGISLIWEGSIPWWIALIVAAAVLVGIVFLAVNYTEPFSNHGPLAVITGLSWYRFIG